MLSSRLENSTRIMRDAGRQAISSLAASLNEQVCDCESRRRDPLIHRHLCGRTFCGFWNSIVHRPSLGPSSICFPVSHTQTTATVSRGRYNSYGALRHNALGHDTLRQPKARNSSRNIVHPLPAEANYYYSLAVKTFKGQTQ